MKKDLVSVITPVYKAEEFIGKTIESVLSQTYLNLEMILVDDQSPDGSAAIIKSMQEKDARVRYFCLPENQGAAVARNKGIELAQGQYVAFIDSDDVWDKNKLEKQLAFMKRNDYYFTYTAVETIKESGEKIGVRNVPQKLNYYQLLKDTAIACSTVIIDRQQIGDFRMPLVRKGQDTATWLFLLRERIDSAYGLNEALTSYRQVEGSISSNKFEALKRTWNTYYNLENLPFPKAAYYYSHYVIRAILKRL